VMCLSIDVGDIISLSLSLIPTPYLSLVASPVTPVSFCLHAYAAAAAADDDDDDGLITQLSQNNPGTLHTVMQGENGGGLRTARSAMALSSASVCDARNASPPRVAPPAITVSLLSPCPCVSISRLSICVWCTVRGA